MSFSSFRQGQWIECPNVPRLNSILLCMVSLTVFVALNLMRVLAGSVSSSASCVQHQRECSMWFINTARLESVTHAGRKNTLISIFLYPLLPPLLLLLLSLCSVDPAAASINWHSSKERRLSLYISWSGRIATLLKSYIAVRTVWHYGYIDGKKNVHWVIAKEVVVLVVVTGSVFYVKSIAFFLTILLVTSR
jgi:hypothetical protein